MINWTDRHCRFFLRLLTLSARRFAEMVTAAALVHGDAERLLQFDVAEHPAALQLGGSDPKMMADAAKLGAQAGYDEININVGGLSGGEFLFKSRPSSPYNDPGPWQFGWGRHWETGQTHDVAATEITVSQKLKKKSL